MRRPCCVLSLILALGSVVRSSAADHLVPTADLHIALTTQSRQREADLAEFRSLLADETVRDQFEPISDLEMVQTSIAGVDDDTLRELADKARQANSDVAAEGKKTVAVLLVAAIVVGSVLLNLIPRDRS